MTRHRRHVDTPRELADQNPTEPTETAGTAHIPDDLLDEALASTGLTALSPEAQRSILALTPETASVEPATWTKLLDAANRGVQHHRNDTAALPRLLFIRRREQESTLEEVADATDVPAKQLDAVEHGRERVETLGSEKVASWIHVLGVGEVQARASLSKALELQRRGDVALAAAAASDSKEAGDKFIEDVIALLEAKAGQHEAGQH